MADDLETTPRTIELTIRPPGAGGTETGIDDGLAAHERARLDEAWQQMLTAPELTQQGATKTPEAGPKPPKPEDESAFKVAVVETLKRLGLTSLLGDPGFVERFVRQRAPGAKPGDLADFVARIAKSADIGLQILGAAPAGAGAAVKHATELGGAAVGAVTYGVGLTGPEAMQPTETVVSQAAGVVAEGAGAVALPPGAMVGPLAKSKAAMEASERGAAALKSQRGSIGAEPGVPNINVDRVTAAREVKATMKKLNAIVSAMEPLKGARETVTHAQTIRDSRMIATNLEDALKLDLEGADMLRPMQQAIRDWHNAVTAHVTELKKLTLRGDDVAAGELADVYPIALALSAKDEMLGAIHARGLEARKILSEASRASITPQEIQTVGERLRLAEGNGDRVLTGRAIAAKLDALPTQRQRESFARTVWDHLLLLKVLGGITAGAGSGTTQEEQIRGAFFGGIVGATMSVTGRQILYNLWINALLTNPVTHSANVLSAAATAAYAPAERFLAAAVDNPFHREVFFGESAMMVYAGFTALKGAVKAFVDSMLTGKGLFAGDDTVIAMERRNPFRAEMFGLAPESHVGGVVDFIGAWGVNLPTRSLQAEDSAAKFVNYQMELAALAYREARLNNLSGRRLAEYVAEVRRRPPPELAVKAENFSMIQTFNEVIEGGAAQTLRDAALTMRREIPGLGYIIPFVSTPTALAQYSLQRTPGVNLLSATLRRDLAAGGATAAQARAKVAMSAFVFALLWKYAQTPVDPDNPVAYMTFITGAGPKDPGQQQMLKGLKWKPNAIWIGGDIGYLEISRVDPFAMTLGIVATAHEIYKNSEPGDELHEDLLLGVQAATLAIGKQTVNKTWLTGLRTTLEAWEQTEGKTDQVVRGLARSVVPAGVAQATRSGIPLVLEADPVMREPQSLLDEMRARTPNLSTGVPPTRDLFAVKQMVPDALVANLLSPLFYGGPRVPDPVREELIALKLTGLRPPKPMMIGGGGKPDEGLPNIEPSMGLPGVKLTDWQRDRMIVLWGSEITRNGNTLHGALAELFGTQNYREMPPQKKQNEVRVVIETYRELAERALREEDLPLDAKVKAHREAVINAQRRTTSEQSPFLGRTGTREQMQKQQELRRGLSGRGLTESLGR